MTDIEALISNLSMAKHGTDMLDTRIAHAIGWSRSETRFFDDGDGEITFQAWIAPDGRDLGFTGSACHSPHNRRYTRSVDDAITLLPQHISYELTQSAVEPPRFARARLWDWRRGPMAIDPGNEWKAEGNSPLPILLCVAALRLVSHSR